MTIIKHVKQHLTYQLDIQCVMSIIASVRKVQRVFQLSLLPVRPAELVNESWNVTQNIVHRHVDFVTIQGTRRLRQTNTKP